MKQQQMGRILVIGASGMLGHKMWQTLRALFPDVVATVRKPREAYARYGVFSDVWNTDRVVDRVDLTESDQLIPLLDRVKPKLIVNCAALTIRRDNSSSVEDNIRLNALLPHILNRWCEANDARLVAFSTDCVFSGKTGGYSEESVPDAEDAYGRTKALGEVQSPRALILRTSIIGREIENKTQLVEWFLSQRMKKSVLGYKRAIFSGVTTLFLSQLVAELIQRDEHLSGVFNVASQPISKHDLLLKLRTAYRLHIDILPDDQKVTVKDLDGRRFERTAGIAVPAWDQMIEDMVKDSAFYDPVVQ